MRNFGREAQMDTPATGRHRTPSTRQCAAVLGSVTIAGSPEHVSGTRAFIARTLEALPGVDCDAATLLTSELVTNAIQHTDSGAPGGTVTVVVIAVPEGVLVEVVDDGSAGTPVVKDDLYAAEGHGLFLVQQLAAQWGYLRDPAGTTVWFHLAAPGQPAEADPLQDYLAAATAVAVLVGGHVRVQIRFMHRRIETQPGPARLTCWTPRLSL
jgi:anti-sigma regulatory factor (Ser/Thr protein kinase)